MELLYTCGFASFPLAAAPFANCCTGRQLLTGNNRGCCLQPLMCASCRCAQHLVAQPYCTSCNFILDLESHGRSCTNVFVLLLAALCVVPSHIHTTCVLCTCQCWAACLLSAARRVGAFFPCLCLACTLGPERGGVLQYCINLISLDRKIVFHTYAHSSTAHPYRLIA